MLSYLKPVAKPAVPEDDDVVLVDAKPASAPKPGDKPKRKRLSNEEKPFVCDYEGCGKRYKTKATMRAHQREKHESEQRAEAAKEKRAREAADAREEAAEAFAAMSDDDKLEEYLRVYDQLQSKHNQDDASESPEEKGFAEAQANVIRKSVHKQLKGSIVYTNSSLKHKNRTIPAVEIPNVSESVLRHLLGEDLAGEKRKSYKLDLSRDDFLNIFPGSYSKFLRYGAMLDLAFPVKLSWSNKQLSVKASYGMF